MKKLMLTIVTIFIVGTLFSAGVPTQFNQGIRTKTLQFNNATELTISGGVITPTQSYHTIDTEADAASDDLDTITTTNLVAGQIIYFKQANSARVVVFKNGTGNIITGSADYTLQDGMATAFIYDGTNLLLAGGGGGSGVPVLTGNRAVITDALGALSVSTTTDSEISYLSGVTSAIQTQFSNLSASTIPIDELGTATYDSIQDWCDVTQSAGVISGGTIADDGDGTITVAAGTGIIKTTNSDIGANKFFDWTETALSLTDNSINFIYVDYNSGTPAVGTSTTNTANGQTIFNLGKAFRESTALDIINSGLRVYNMPKRAQQQLVERYGIEFVSGAVVSETGTRNIALSAGVMYAGLNRIATDAFDSSGADTFEYYYYTGSAWTESDQQAIDNTQYNDVASGLATLSNNQYGIHWVYKGGGSKIYVLYGQGSYTLVEAEAVQPPSSLPTHVSEMGSLRAKIIILKSASTFTEIANVSEVMFSYSAASDHNELSGLQGGAAGEYYHLTSAFNTALTTLTTGDIYYASAANTLAKLGIGTEDQRLVVSSGGIPEWETIPVTAFNGNFDGDTADAGFSWSSNVLTVTHGLTATPDAKTLLWSIVDTDGNVYSPLPVYSSSTTTTIDLDFTAIGKPGNTDTRYITIIAAGGSGSQTDTTAIHDNVAGEVNAITAKTTLVDADILLIEDSAASWAKKKVTISNLTATDATAIHDNVANEITAITAITDLATADEFVLEDASDTYAKKAITAGNIKKFVDVPTINAQTGTTYTLAIGDAGNVVTMTNGSANTLTIPLNSSVAFPVGTVIVIMQGGAGVTTVDAVSGVTLNGVDNGGGAMSGQYKAVYIIKIATDTWMVVGAIGTVA